MAEYSEYKESDQQWLGKIPSHWKILPGKAVFEENKSRNKDNQENFVLSLSYGKIIPKKDINEGLVPDNYSGYQIVKPGYIIVRCTDLQNDKVSLRTGLVQHTGIISGAYLGLIPKDKYSSSFLQYLLFDWDISKELYRYGSGLRQSLSWEDIKYLLLPIPPKEEQEAIVAYLDKVTTDIDKAIAAKERIIASLEERRKIIITHAVTRGINPDAPLKDSGIDWLGQIPSHWDCTKLKYFIRIKSGESVSNSDLSDVGEYLVYGGGEPLGRYGRFNVTAGTIIVGRVGARCGCVTQIQQNAWATDNALIITPEGMPMKYLYYLLIGTDLNKKASTNAQPLLTGTKVKNTFFALPPVEEQQEIVKFLEYNTSGIDIAIAQQKKLIELLRERKNIIINETVTGKVKVI